MTAAITITIGYVRLSLNLLEHNLSIFEIRESNGTTTITIQDILHISRAGCLLPDTILRTAVRGQIGIGSALNNTGDFDSRICNLRTRRLLTLVEQTGGRGHACGINHQLASTRPCVVFLYLEHA